MASKSEGSGSAADAEVATDDESTVQDADLKAEAQARVDGIQSRIDKLEEHLDGMKQSLAQAKADQKDVN